MKHRILNLSWVAFFLTFFAWFNMAPFNRQLIEQFGLTSGDMAWLMAANLSLTIPARLVIGWLVDHYGPRKTFTWLLAYASVVSVFYALSSSYEMLVLSRVLSSVIGGGFVVGITMIAQWWPEHKIGLAQGIYAGWGNAGSAFAAIILPWFGDWRIAAFVSAGLCFGWALVYGLYSSDNRPKTQDHSWVFLKDSRVWVLAIAYAVCFGGELAVVSMLPQWFGSTWNVSLVMAGALASGFALTNLFARPFGGFIADRLGRAKALSMALAGMGVGATALSMLSVAEPIAMAVLMVVLAGMFVQAAEGAVFALAPLLSPAHTGKIAGVVGAAGNAGALVFIWALGMLGPQWFFMTLGAAALMSILLTLAVLVPHEGPVRPIEESSDG